MLKLVRYLLVAMVLALSSQSLAQDVYSNPTLGFSIRKPSSWHYLTADQHRENLKRSDFADPKFKELVTRYARTPFSRHHQAQGAAQRPQSQPPGQCP